MDSREKPHGDVPRGKNNVRPSLEKQDSSPLIEKIRANDYCLRSGRLEIYLAREFGFCYGVERAVEYAYETRLKFPDRRIFLTDEIIHNPRVNRELRELGIRFLSGPSACGLAVTDLDEKDVVIMPAFGVPVNALKEYQERGCVIVDTTCGSVMSVWRRVESYARDGFTSVIHGKYDHEETRATCSRAGKYLVVRDQAQARQVCDLILRGDDKASNTPRENNPFLADFKRVCSEGFDPGKDLEKIGFANQTTMLMSESIVISDVGSVEASHGLKLPCVFRHFDTICRLPGPPGRHRPWRKADGFNFRHWWLQTSNTGHLAEIASSTPTFILKTPMVSYRKKISHETLILK